MALRRQVPALKAGSIPGDQQLVFNPVDELRHPLDSKAMRHDEWRYRRLTGQGSHRPTGIADIPLLPGTAPGKRTVRVTTGIEPLTDVDHGLIQAAHLLDRGKGGSKRLVCDRHRPSVA